MSVTARRLNKRGLRAFASYVDQLRDGSKLPAPVHLLTDDDYSEELEIPVSVGDDPFETRYDIGKHLVRAFRGKNMQPLLGDIGFWTWLALFWFDQLCPPAADGSRKPSKEYNYILSTNYNHRPRHAIRTTWLLVDRYGEDSLFLLSKKPNERGELIEQLAARQYFISCQGVIGAAAALYYDPDRATFKRGATSQKRKGTSVV
ncbi:MAG: hypothetical protein H6962_08400 [Chromatiaceae bacterium]|nr:hypothetical protein [Chromatiaceae bacterium]